jgi:hypothetical protein
MADEFAWAKEDAQRALKRLGATMLRTISGSTYAVYDLRQRLAAYIDAQNTMNALRGDDLTPGEEREALELPKIDPDVVTDFEARMFLVGSHLIMQGALRLAAHEILGERPHFGGKHSEEVIKEGIKFRERGRKPF